MKTNGFIEKEVNSILGIKSEKEGRMKLLKRVLFAIKTDQQKQKQARKEREFSVRKTSEALTNIDKSCMCFVLLLYIS